MGCMCFVILTCFFQVSCQPRRFWVLAFAMSMVYPPAKTPPPSPSPNPPTPTPPSSTSLSHPPTPTGKTIGKMPEHAAHD